MDQKGRVGIHNKDPILRRAEIHRMDAGLNHSKLDWRVIAAHPRTSVLRVALFQVTESLSKLFYWDIFIECE